MKLWITGALADEKVGSSLTDGHCLNMCLLVIGVFVFANLLSRIFLLAIVIWGDTSA